MSGDTDALTPSARDPKFNPMRPLLTALILCFSSASASALGSLSELRLPGATCTAYDSKATGLGSGVTHCLFPAGALKTYPHPVAIHIPHHFERNDTLNVVLYFHGLSDHTKALPYDYVDSVFEPDMGMALSQARSSTLLVMPSGTKGNGSFKRHLTARASDFDAFMSEVIALLHAASLSESAMLGRFVVAGHSGAHRPLRQLLSVSCQKTPCYRDEIDEMYLMDASYVMDGAEGLPFAKFANTGGKRLHVLFRAGTVITQQSRVLYNHIHGTTLKGDADFCNAHKNDLKEPLKCDFTCVTHKTLKRVTRWKRGPSLHYKIVPIFLWRLLDARCDIEVDATPSAEHK